MQNRKRKSEIIDERIMPGKIVCENYENDAVHKAFAVISSIASGTTAMVRLHTTNAGIKAVNSQYELQQSILLNMPSGAMVLHFADVSRLIIKDSVQLLAALGRSDMATPLQLSGYDMQCIVTQLHESRTISRDLKNSYLQ